MVPDSRRTGPDDGDRPSTERGVDAAVHSGLDEAQRCTVIRDAVDDALLSVVGTLLLLCIAVSFVAGGQALFGTPPTVGVAFGIGVVAVGVYLAAATLELILRIRDWS